MANQNFSENREIFPPEIETKNSISLLEFGQSEKERINDIIYNDGCLVLKGFKTDINTFESFIDVACGGSLPYTEERSSPRHSVEGKVYTSTDYPKTLPIFPHNEQSFFQKFAMKLAFYSQIVAESGGETPVCNTRKVLNRIDPSLRNRLVKEGYLYVRNLCSKEYKKGIGLSWQAVYQTDDLDVVKDYCSRHDIQVEETKNGAIKTSQRRNVLAKHPVTGDHTWFNHLTFFNYRTLPEQMIANLRDFFDIADYPNNTYFIDGSELSEDEISHLQSAYKNEIVARPWGVEEIMIVDNLVTSHARSAFTGDRKVLVTLSELSSWENCMPDIDSFLSEAS